MLVTVVLDMNGQRSTCRRVGYSIDNLNLTSHRSRFRVYGPQRRFVLI